MRNTIISLLALCVIASACDDGSGGTWNECTMGDTQCSGDMVQHCNEGAWTDYNDCSVSGQTCAILNGSAQCFAGGDTDTDTDSDSDTDTDSDSDTDTDSDSDTDTDSDSDTDTDSDSDSDTDADAGPDSGSDAGCPDEAFPIEPKPAKMVILHDISGSWFAYGDWTEASTALDNFVTDWTGSQIQFGLDYFPNDGSCGVNSTIPISPVAGSESTIITWANTISPTGMTPLVCALHNFHDWSYTAGAFPHPTIDSYLVLISDGSETCEPACGGGGTASDELASITSTLVFDGMKIAVLIYDWASTDLDVVAANGGMDAPYDVPVHVSTSTGLEAAYNDMAHEITACVYDVMSAEATANYQDVNFYINDGLIPMDDGCTGGGVSWQWTDSSHTQMQFCEDACDGIESLSPTLIGKWGCATVVAK